MLHPVEAMDSPVTVNEQGALTRALARLRIGVRCRLGARYTARDLFTAMLSLLETQPTVIFRSQLYSGSYWFTAPDGRLRLVLNTAHPLCYAQGVFLLIDLLVTAQHCDDGLISAPFDSPDWCTHPRYARQRALFASFMTTTLSPTFHPTY